MIIVVLSPSEYRKWMKTKQTFKDSYFAAAAVAAAPADTLAPMTKAVIK
jgi:heme/copper-type cytochrome/quinol oxidase subunit 2